MCGRDKTVSLIFVLDGFSVTKKCCLCDHLVNTGIWHTSCDCSNCERNTGKCLTKQRSGGPILDGQTSSSKITAFTFDCSSKESDHWKESTNEWWVNPPGFTVKKDSWLLFWANVQYIKTDAPLQPEDQLHTLLQVKETGGEIYERKLMMLFIL